MDSQGRSRRTAAFVLRASAFQPRVVPGPRSEAAIRVAAYGRRRSGPAVRPAPVHRAPLAIGIYELAKDRGRTAVDTLKSWCQQQTFTTVWPSLQS